MRSDDPRLVSVLRSCGLLHCQEVLAPWASLGIELVPTSTPTSHATRLGGEPMLPPDVSWPVQQWTTAEVASWPEAARAELDMARARGQVVVDAETVSMPLRFLGIIDLTAVRVALEGIECGLPPEGHLVLYASLETALPAADLSHRVAAAAIYSATGSAVSCAHPAQPEELLDGAVYLEPRLSVLWHEDVWNGVRDALTTDELLLVSGLRVANEAAHWLMPPPPITEQVGTATSRAQTAILRVAEVPSIGLFIGDSSWLTWVIPPEDLASRCFDRVRASVFVG